MPNQVDILDYSQKYNCDLLILAAGFEKRGVKFIKDYIYLNNTKKIIVLKYTSHESDNQENLDLIISISEKLLGEKPLVCEISTSDVKNNTKNLESHLIKITSLGIKDILIDVSSMTHFLIFQTLDSVQKVLPSSLIRVVYTEANEYFPKEEEEEKFLDQIRRGLIAEDLLSHNLRDVFILKEFIGNFKPNLPICLLMLVGYEVYRTEGIIEQYAPSRVIFFYGESPVPDFSKRANFSKNLHELKGIIKLVPSREETISTLYIDEVLNKLEEFYNLYVHNYNVCIAPQCSKMQTVASYLFCKKHKDVQTVFTQPVAFNVKDYSKGSRTTYYYLI